jgi:DNA-binding response OmpR family regulator
LNDKILVIDDEPSVHEVVRAYLEREGFIVYSANNGRDGLQLAEAKQPSLLVLDVMLPDVSGEEICAYLRRTSDVAILFLTARGTEEDRVRGLEMGADDYLPKPFSPRELVARVKALLRRTQGSDVGWAERLSFDDGALQIDAARHRVIVRERPVTLTPSEFKLLLALAQSPGRVYSRYELIYRVRGYDYAGYERTIDAHVKNLRKKIELDPASPRYVETVHGVGYRLAEGAA